MILRFQIYIAGKYRYIIQLWANTVYLRFKPKFIYFSSYQQLYIFHRHYLAYIAKLLPQNTRTYFARQKCRFLRAGFYCIICSNKFVCDFSYIHLQVWHLIDWSIIQYTYQQASSRSFGHSVSRLFIRLTLFVRSVARRSVGCSFVCLVGGSVNSQQPGLGCSKAG